MRGLGGFTAELDMLVFEPARSRAVTHAATVIDAKNWSGMVVPTILDKRPLLQQLCGGPSMWLSLPIHPWPTLMANLSAVDALKHLSANSTKSLTDKWQQRHTGLRAQAKERKVQPVRYQPCRFGACVCDTTSRKIIQRLIALLKRQPMELLTSGQLLLTWMCFDLKGADYDDNDSDVDHEEPLPSGLTEFGTKIWQGQRGWVPRVREALATLVPQRKQKRELVIATACSGSGCPTIALQVFTQSHS
eukprot:5977982-Amphidinium_carterae.7